MVEQTNNDFPYAVAVFPRVGIHGMGERPHLYQTSSDMVQKQVKPFNSK